LYFAGQAKRARNENDRQRFLRATKKNNRAVAKDAPDRVLDKEKDRGVDAP
jgi:hypothetical protein